MSTIHFNNFNIKDVPVDTVFVLDTNVLYYVHSGYSPKNPKDGNAYSNIIQEIMNNGFKIHVSALSVQELLFCIENKEYKNYCDLNPSESKNYSKKQYRKNKSERTRVKQALNTVLSELSIYTMDDGQIMYKSVDEFVNTYETHKMDPMDYLLTLNYDFKKTIFISADKDFRSLNSIKVLTA